MYDEDDEDEAAAGLVTNFIKGTMVFHFTVKNNPRHFSFSWKDSVVAELHFTFHTLDFLWVEPSPLHEAHT